MEHALKTVDFVPKEPKTNEMDYKGALIFAMNREKESFRLYMSLANSTEEEDVRDTFISLANEEARHKLRIEVEYDDFSGNIPH